VIGWFFSSRSQKTFELSIISSSAEFTRGIDKFPVLQTESADHVGSPQNDAMIQREAESWRAICNPSLLTTLAQGKESMRSRASWRERLARRICHFLLFGGG
jgi:hypothetical protein